MVITVNPIQLFVSALVGAMDVDIECQRDDDLALRNIIPHFDQTTSSEDTAAALTKSAEYQNEKSTNQQSATGSTSFLAGNVRHAKMQSSALTSA